MDENKPSKAAVWRERIVAWRSSGQSVREWCKAHHCHEHAFYWWRAKLGGSTSSRKRPRVAVPAGAESRQDMQFAAVVVERASAVTEPIRLRLGGGRELLLPVSTPIESVATLVRVIEGLA